jgi:predicted transcriptional regulator
METQDYRRLNRRNEAVLRKLLGDLELEIMELMWDRKQATVRDIVLQLRPTRPRAYTTIMTVMFHLSEKGLLHLQQQNRKTYVYTIAMTRDQYLDSVVSRMVDGLVEDFGDRALAQFRTKLERPTESLTHTNVGDQPAPVPTDYTQPTVH